MSDVLDRAKAHFQSFDRQSHNVPEWGLNETPLIVYWTPLTLHERRKIYAPDERGPVDGQTIFVRAIIMKAQDSEGKNLFDAMAEKVLWHGVDPAVLARLASRILGMDTNGSDAGDATGND